MERRFGITVTSRMRHAALLRAAKRLGSQKALGDFLGVSQQEIGSWVALRSVPSFLRKNLLNGNIKAAHEARIAKRWTDEKIQELESKLFEVTGQTVDELFPEELCSSREFLAAKKTIEQTRHVDTQLLETYAPTRFILPAPDEVVAEADASEYLKETLTSILKTISGRERHVLELRYGIGGVLRHTLEETATIVGVTRERVRQIENRALQKCQRHKNRLAPVFGEQIYNTEEI